MKYLVGMPCLFGYEHTKEAIESVVHKQDVDVLLIDNGAEQKVKELLINNYSIKQNVTVLSNKENIYVNPAWNQIMDFFLGSYCDYLLIMNSDLTLQTNWKNALDAHLTKYHLDIPVPVISNDRKILNEREVNDNGLTFVFEGTPGVLIVLSKEHVKKVYPIPETIKVWFGDNWIYEGLRKLGYKTVVLSSLLSYHSGSQNVSKVQGISEIIEIDKLEWAKLQ